MSLNKCTMINQNMQQNRKVSKNKQEKFKMSTYFEIKEPNVEKKEVEMKEFSSIFGFPKQLIDYCNACKCDLL